MESKSKESEASPIIFDSAVLSNFAIAQVFHVLQRLYTGRAFVPKAVQREIQARIKGASTCASAKNLTQLEEINQALNCGWLQIPPEQVNPNDDAIELRLQLEYSKRFSMGESEAMAIARNRNWVFASDDGAARNFAKERDIRLTGTLGILIKAVQTKILCLSLADLIHAQMIDEGYCSPLSYENGISSYRNL